MGDLSKDFSSDEFECKCGCGFNLYNKRLILALQHTRDDYGKPIIIISGCRCSIHNKNVGGSNNSEHVTAEGVDIDCASSRERFILLPILFKYFKRIGIKKTFIHVGISKTKDNKVLWLY